MHELFAIQQAREARCLAARPMPGAWGRLWSSCPKRHVVLHALANGQPLSGMDLAGADLRRLDLRAQDLSEVDMTRANLKEARLDRASLLRTIFDEADLSEARLTFADVRGASFRAARLDETDLRGARWDEGTSFEDSTVSAAWVGIHHQVRAAPGGGLRRFVRAREQGKVGRRWLRA